MSPEKVRMVKKYASLHYLHQKHATHPKQLHSACLRRKEVATKSDAGDKSPSTSTEVSKPRQKVMTETENMSHFKGQVSVHQINIVIKWRVFIDVTRWIDRKVFIFTWTVGCSPSSAGKRGLPKIKKTCDNNCKSHVAAAAVEGTKNKRTEAKDTPPF